MANHESFDREEGAGSSSPRSFGLAFAGFFLIVAILKLFFGGAYQYWLGAGIFFLATSLLLPGIFGPLSRLWAKFGLALHRITTPVIMAVLFYGAVLPTGLAMRLCGKDLLRLRRKTKVSSYWIARDPPGPRPEGMKDQF